MLTTQGTKATKGARLTLACDPRILEARGIPWRSKLMYFDGWLEINDLRRVAADAQAAEAVGFDGLWTSEIAHDPYLPLALAATATSRVQLGTAIALAFTRSPTTTAHTAWDLARLS